MSTVLASKKMKALGYYYFLKQIWLTKIFKQKYPDIVYPIVRVLCLNEGDNVRSNFTVDYVPLDMSEHIIVSANGRLNRLLNVGDHTHCGNVLLSLHEKSFLIIVPIKTHALEPASKIMCFGKFNKIDLTTGYYLAYEIEEYAKGIGKHVDKSDLQSVTKVVKKIIKMI